MPISEATMATNNIAQSFLALTQLFFYVLSCVFPRRKNAGELDPETGVSPTADKGTEQVQVEEKVEGGEEEDLEVLELMPFQPAIRLINFEALKAYALKFRAHLSGPTDLTCVLDEKPMRGGFNVVYVVHFSDGCRWIARIPINAPNFGALEKQKMDSEYHTMRYLRSDLQIPIPEIFAWHTDSDIIGAPFALMSFVTGTSVMDRWADREWITEERKLKILSNCAKLMAVLQGPTWGRTGTLRFTSGGRFSCIGPEILMEIDEDTYDTEGTVLIEDKQTCHSLDEWMLVDGDPLTGLPDAGRWQIGCLKVIHLALASVPAYLRRTDRFVLEMVDYNCQNVFVDDDCNITGVIDWDGVRVVPQGMGATRYPSWITRDWEPGNYLEPQDGDWDETGEDPPESLSKYRKHYADMFASLNLPNGYDAAETRLSHILEAIKLAARSRLERQYTAIKLLHHAFRGNVPFTSSKCFDSLIDAESDEGKVMAEKVAEAFKSMWHAEWEYDETKANNAQRFADLMPKA